MNSKNTPQFILKKYFGYTQFRTGQLEIIVNILNKKNTLAILPTGGGKSVCFQVPGIILSQQEKELTNRFGVTLVISPLISLMKDQVDTLNSKGISACYLSGLLSKQNLNTTYELIKLNKFKFIYIAPERLKSKRFQAIVSKLKISLLVIDEAHCISQWGDNFRPIYKEIIEYTKSFKNQCPIAAFTATANKKVQKDICNSLKFENPFIYFHSFKRNNLFIEVINCHNRTIKNISLIRILKKHKNQTGIIYCATRRSTKELTNYLKMFKINSEFYHGGLEKEQKQKVQLAFASGLNKIIVSTNAFGMGIDVSDIRFVIHYQIPSNIENYYQEIGRAGRDNQPAFCYTLFCKSDERIQYQLLKKYKEKIKEFEKLKKLLKIYSCRTKEVLKYFGEKSEKCNNCDVCKNIKYKSQLMIHISNQEKIIIKTMINFRKLNKKLSRRFPLTDILIALIVLLKPKNIEDYLLIPGIGKGFIKIWYKPIQQLLA